MTTTLVLVHGAWHAPSTWDLLIEQLGDIPTVTVDLPSSGTDPDRLGDLTDDAAEVTRVLQELDGPSVVLAHSYGGIPVTEAVTTGLGVRHIVYLAAFVLDVGESLFDLVGRQPAPWWDPQGTYLGVKDPASVFYNGVPQDVTAAAVEQLGWQSMASIQQPVSRTAWREVPTTYVACTQDQAIPLPGQEAMAQRTGAVHRLTSGHSPFLSQPDQVAAIVKPVVSGITA